MNTKKWSKEEIAYKMETDNVWLYRGLMAIYKHQTEDEKSSGITKHDNGIGFNGVDANFMTNLALFYKSYGFLTQKQLAHCRKKMKKYAKQLSNIANGVV